MLPVKDEQNVLYGGSPRPAVTSTLATLKSGDPVVIQVERDGSLTGDRNIRVQWPSFHYDLMFSSL